MNNADTAIAAIFETAQKDPDCKVVTGSLQKLHAEGGWEGPAILAIVQKGEKGADQKG